MWSFTNSASRETCPCLLQGAAGPQDCQLSTEQHWKLQDVRARSLCVHCTEDHACLRTSFPACCRVPSPPGLPPADWAALDAAGQQLLRRLQLASLQQRHIAAELAAVAGAQPGAVAGRSREVADGLMASAHTNNALLGSGESLPFVLCCFEHALVPGHPAEGARDTCSQEHSAAGLRLDAGYSSA